MKSMIIKCIDNQYRQYVCTNSEHWDFKRYPPDSVVDDLIPHFENTAQARKAGWKKTDDWRICAPDEDSVWACPDCVKRYGL